MTNPALAQSDAIQSPPWNGFPERLFTVADLAAMPDELPSGPVLYELDNGRLITMPPPGYVHGSVEARCTSAFHNQGQVPGLGKVCCGEVGIILWRNPDRVVGADVAFISNTSLPIRRSKEGYLETIPDVVVEIFSKNDTWTAVRQKVADYLKAGVRVVWVADPGSQTVTVFCQGQETVFSEKETLTLEDIIPGFNIEVGFLFQE